MAKVQREEGIERQASPELARYFDVASAATASMVTSLFKGLGPEVLDDDDRAAMFPPATKVTSAEIVSFPTPPGLGEVATDSAGITPQELANVTPLSPVAPVQDFPDIRPPFEAAA